MTNNNGDIKLNNIISSGDIYLTNKNGNIEGNIIGSYDDYIISKTIKKGETNLTSFKESGNKKLNVSNNNGNIYIDIDSKVR